MQGFGTTFFRLVKDKEWASELDWVLSCGVDIGRVKKKENAASDHHIILWSIEGRVSQEKQQTLTRSMNTLLKNKERFLQSLLKHPWESLPDYNLEEQASLLCQHIVTSLDEIVPLRYTKQRKRYCPIPSQELQELRRERDNARKNRKTKQYRRLRNRVVLCSRQERQKEIDKRIMRDPNEVWHVLEELQGKTKSKQSNIFSDGEELSGEKAAQHFNVQFIDKIEQIKKSLGTTEEEEVLKTTKARVSKLQLGQKTISFKPVKEEHVRKAIKKMKSSKAVDCFGISPFVLKMASPVITTPLTYIIGGSLAMAQVPNSWKEANITPLHKKKSKKDAKNYRPVSILSTPSKVLESVVRDQLSEQIENLKILPNSQHGFRRDCSTITAVAALEHDLKLARQKKMCAGAVFLDLSAAFDTLDGNILALKFKEYGASTRVRKWIISYLSGRRQRVQYQGKASSTMSNDTGAPQGSILSPFLFLVLVSDMEEALQGMEGVRLMSYADDTTVYAWAETADEVHRKLEEAVEKILGFMRVSGLSANPEKTNFIHFGPGDKLPIGVGGTAVQSGKEEKLVGVWISEDLSWERNLQEKERTLRGRIGLLRRLSWHLPRHTMIRCIQAIFTSQLTYGLELMADPLKHQNKNLSNCTVIVRLQRLLNEAVRAALRISKHDMVSQEELMRRGRQKAVVELAEKALANQAWNALATEERKGLSEVTRRIDWGQTSRETRQNTQEILPPQTVSNTLISRVAGMWNNLPEELKSERLKTSAKSKIRKFFDKS